MKKNIKQLIATVTVGLALVGAGGLTAFAAGYVTWGGTEDFESLMSNLQTIGGKATGLKDQNEKQANEIAGLKADNKNKDNQLLEKDGQISDKDNQISDKNNQIKALEQDIEDLQERVDGGMTTQDQLKQAEIDMKNAKEKSEEVLESIGEVE